MGALCNIDASAYTWAQDVAFNNLPCILKAGANLGGQPAAEAPQGAPLQTPRCSGCTSLRQQCGHRRQSVKPHRGLPLLQLAGAPALLHTSIALHIDQVTRRRAILLVSWIRTAPYWRTRASIPWGTSGKPALTGAGSPGMVRRRRGARTAGGGGRAGQPRGRPHSQPAGAVRAHRVHHAASGQVRHLLHPVSSQVRPAAPRPAPPLPFDSPDHVFE